MNINDNDVDSSFVFGVRVEGDAFTGQKRRDRKKRRKGRGEKEETEKKGVEGIGGVIMPE